MSVKKLDIILQTKFNLIGNQCHSLRMLIVLNNIHLAIYWADSHLVSLKHQCGFIVWSLHKLWNLYATMLLGQHSSWLSTALFGILTLIVG